jgi:tight adherence protein C
MVALLFILIGGVALAFGLRRPLLALVEIAEAPGETLEDQRSFTERVIIPTVRGTAGRLGRLTPSAYREKIQRRIVMAGAGDLIRPEELIAIQAAATALGVFVGAAIAVWMGVGGRAVTILMGFAGFAGWALPSARLNRAAELRRASIRCELPDFVDNLRVAIQAGAAVEGALDLILEDREGPLSEEMHRVLSEIRLGRHRHEAFVRFRARVDVSEVGTLVSSLIQADELGMPLAQVLKAQADELRLRRRQWAREKAGKLPVKITMPLVLLIFPPILVITAGPAMSGILTVL